MGPLAVQLAKLMETDISENFGPGQRFLTVREVADRYGVSTITAHRAMPELAKRRVLEVHPGSGSFVGPGAVGKKSGSTTVQFIMSEAVEPTVLGGILIGVMSGLPGVSIQVSRELRGDVEGDLDGLMAGRGVDLPGRAVLSGRSGGSPRDGPACSGRSGGG